MNRAGYGWNADGARDPAKSQEADANAAVRSESSGKEFCEAASTAEKIWVAADVD